MGVRIDKQIFILLLIWFVIMSITEVVSSIDNNRENRFINNEYSDLITNNTTSKSNRNSAQNGITEIIYPGYGQMAVQPKIVVNNNIFHVICNDYSGWNQPVEFCGIDYIKSINAGMTWENKIGFDFPGEEFCSYISPNIAINGSNVYLVWGQDWGGSGVRYTNSTNDGQNWSEVRVIVNDWVDATAIGLNKSTIYIVWCSYNESDIFLKKSIDGGKTWGNEIRLTNNGSVVTSLLGIKVNNNNIHIIWVDKRDGNHEMFYKKSEDAGVTWTNDTRLTNNASQSEYPGMAVDGNNIHVVWMDNRYGDFDIYYKKSIDNGNSWTSDIKLTTNNSNQREPTIAIEGNKIHVVWSINTTSHWNDELFYKFSVDGGNNWSNDINLNVSYINGWYCPPQEPSIALKDNYLFLVWSAHVIESTDSICFKYFPFLPRVIVYPNNNSIDTPISTNISMMFNQYMNHNSVENAFSISPNTPGTFQWDDKNYTCNFIPSSNLSYNTTYTIKLDGTAGNLTSATLDGNGNGISEGSPIDDFKWSFTTEQYINPDKSPPNIVSINPLNNAQNVLINTSIQVIFNESMNKSTTETAFSIIPKVDGNFNWAGNDKICTFVPLSNFNYSTTYDIIISGVAKDLAGNTLDGNKNGIGEGSIFDDFEWSFKTEKFIPISVLVYPINQEILGQTPYFKWTLDNKITNATPAVYYDYYLSSNESLVENLDDSACVVHNLTNNIYQVLINISNEYYWTVIPHTNDTFGYCKSGVWHFRVDVPPWDSIPPQIVSIYPKNNSIDINVDSNIQVIFNEPMNWTSVEQAFSIYPEVDGDFRWTDNNTIMTFYPQNYFETSKMYFVNISTLAKDSAGNPLDGNKNFNRDGSPLDDYIWSFTTAAVQNLKPKIKIDFPKNGSVFNINETIYFDCINSTDPDGDILEFLWKSNISGILSTAPQFNIYLPIGHHQITLFVNDGHGHNISASVNIIVTPWNRPPTAVISSPLDGAVFNATELIYFDALNSSDPDNDILSFYWHSNISGGLGQSPKFKMKLPAGHHLITLFVSDPFYHTVNVSINIYVLNGSSGPPANGNGPAPLKPPDTGTDSNIIARVGLYSGIIAIIIIIIITAFITTTEVGKYGFLGYVMPLYSRIKGKKVLDNETRGMIRGYIIANPGDHFNSIKRNLKLKNGALTYHLKVLEREELIKSERDGIFKRFYPIEERVPANLMHVSRIQEKILNEIIDRPGITQMGLAKRLEVSHQVVNYHIKKLVSSRLVKAERLGKKTKYYPIEDQGLIK